MNFSEFLKSFSDSPIFVIDRSIPISSYVKIDLSVNNSNINVLKNATSKDWETYINKYLHKSEAKVAYGGYLEERNLYSRSAYFNNNEDKRNIHLGIDFWHETGTKVLAALDGTIHSFKNNTNFGDYGPTIILEHVFHGNTFYSLYGHLSLESFYKLKIGLKIKQGQVIGNLGEASINGNYAPHLHFQLIKDLQGLEGDYPGVCSKKKLAFYKNNCPDPNLLLKLE
jgi:murein DD-endopeptidase MepM/ murein hydrolase activator NlpD